MSPCITTRPRRLATAFMGLALVLVPACSKGGGGTKAAGPSKSTTTAAAPTTTVGKPLDSDNLADRLVGVDDVGSDWQQEGQQYIGEDDVKASSGDRRIKETMSCDGKPADRPQATGSYHGVAAVGFMQDNDYPTLVEQLSTAPVADLEKDLSAFTTVYGNCEHATMTATDGTETATADATINQFGIPDTGADKQYAYVITYEVFGHQINFVDVFMIKGTTAVTLGYTGIDAYDPVQIAHLATVAIDKLSKPANANTSS